MNFQIGPGVYREGDEIRFDIPELLRANNLSDNEINRRHITEIAREKAIEAGFMTADIPMIRVHRHPCIVCHREWRHDGHESTCNKPDPICPKCDS